MKWAALLLAWLGGLEPAATFAQHEGHPPAGVERPVVEDSPESSDRNLFQSDMSRMAGMQAEDPMAGMEMPGWHVMDLGVARLVFNGQGGPSGRKSGESSNWNMLHAQHDLFGGRLSLMLMNSLEPATFPRGGSAELFQTGETYNGKLLVDRQHPHDFFMNISATYRRQIGDRSALWVQLAPMGEPALGPTAFMHRSSAGEDPTAPLGHHWEDSTHITSDVVTVGYGWRALSLEGSVFHGAEPDENRWNLESGRLDSVSGRLKIRLADGWSGQVSYGFLEKPEAGVPGNQRRATASIEYGAAGDRPFAATLLWGRNDEDHGASSAWLLEGAWQLTRRDQVYGRAEYAQKEDDLLEFKGQPHEAPPDEPRLAGIGAFTAGYLRELPLWSAARTGIGADVTVYVFPSRLGPVYGTFPVSGHFFFRLRWGSGHGAAHSM